MAVWAVAKEQNWPGPPRDCRKDSSEGQLSGGQGGHPAQAAQSWSKSDQPLSVPGSAGIVACPVPSPKAALSQAHLPQPLSPAAVLLYDYNF